MRRAHSGQIRGTSQVRPSGWVKVAAPERMASASSVLAGTRTAYSAFIVS